MASTVAAMKGRLGSTDYYIIAMKAKELVEKAIIPAEIEGWDEKTLEERYQREINYNRVRRDIAPYLANNKDRFFGALILAAQNFDASSFEPISDVVKGAKELLKNYQTPSKVMGFLTFDGGEVLIPLDGQHRLKAIQFALKGKDQHGKKIANISPCTDLAKEDVTVILIPFDPKKSRKIFTRVNRYAKPTSTGENLITDDEDFIAVSARMIANDIIGADLVKIRGNALGDREGAFFTTLATIAECNRAILIALSPEPVTKPFLVDNVETKTLYERKINEVWEHLVEHISEFSDLLADKTDKGNDRRCEMRTDNLLGKPVPQLCLFKAFVRLEASNEFALTKASDQLNKIDWRKDAKLWEELLMHNNKILTKNAKIATDIIYYVAGGKNTDDEKVDAEEAKLLENYRNLFPKDEQKNIQLPPKV